jgi:hypothetical protein
MRLRIVILIVVFAVLLILVECTWLQRRRQAQRIAWANAQVEQKVAAARIHLQEQHWNEAIRELEDALDVEGATNGNIVDPVLEKARRGQAEALLDAASIALAHRRPDDALRLLRAYLAHPQAGRLDRACLLRDDLERALSDDEAMRLLMRLSDEALTLFAEKGQLTVDDGLHTEATRLFFQETLRRNVAKERQKRQAQREVARLSEERRAAEQARRIARLRKAPAFHSLSTFLAQMQEQLRDQQLRALRQKAELERLFQILGVNDAVEQEQIRADLLDRQTPADIREQIERKRTEVKHTYRDDPQFHRANGALFDQLVDQEVDKFLKMLPSY